jgi:diadenosine tetraphosphate (Ap4A) HIT family hydrolase
MPARNVGYDRNNIFARILRGELPCRKVYEDAFALAFHDIHPKAAVHVLVIPKGAYMSFVDFTATAPPEMQAGFWRAVATVAKDLGVEDGFRLVSNIGPEGGQIVFHFHVHIVSGPRP